MPRKNLPRSSSSSRQSILSRTVCLIRAESLDQLGFHTFLQVALGDQPIPILKEYRLAPLNLQNTQPLWQARLMAWIRRISVAPLPTANRNAHGASKLTLRSRLGVIGYWMALSLLLGSNAWGQGRQPFITGTQSFSIPFQVDAKIPNPVEVQLYVSENGGQNWQLYARQRPDAKVFQFQAKSDGTYWFASRTIADKEPVSQRSLVPELQVIIDSQRPQLQLEVLATGGRSIRATWRAEDFTLRAETLRLEYKTQDGFWQPVRLSQRSRATANGIEGEQLFEAENTGDEVPVRVEIRDRAGNFALAEKSVRLVDPGPGMTQPTTQSDSLDPVTGRPPRGLSGEGSSPFRDPITHQPSVPRASISNAPSAFAERAESPFRAANSNVAGGTSQPERIPNRAPVAGTPSRFGQASESQQIEELPAPQAGNTPPTMPRPTGWPAPSRREPFESAPRTEMTEFSGAPPSGANADADNQAYPPPSAAAPAGEPLANLPGGERPRLVGIRQFELDYDVSGVGPAGVAEVELWVTSDFGQTWSRWARDADRESPILVDMNEDGTFGYRVVVLGTNGLSGRPPRPGDLADLWLTVDTTGPQVQLTSAVYGKGQQAGHLILRWHARDANLGSRPISLMYSEHPNGPWQTIVAGLPNQAQYAWRADAKLPDAIFLRIEARDEAGNMGSHQLTDPIRVEGLAPKAKIRGIRIPESIDRAARRPAGGIQ